LRRSRAEKGSRPRRPRFPALAALLALLGGAPVQARAEPIERILAVVDGRPLMLSEVRLLQRVRGLDQEPAVEALVDERLMLREASRLPQAAIGADEEERAYASLLERHAGELAGLPESELRRLARRQTAILKYVEFRFRPQVRVSDEDVRRAYDEAYAGQAAAPGLEAVAEELRRRLADRDLGERLEAWVRELRSSAVVRYNR
jgi:hypothetical protein